MASKMFTQRRPAAAHTCAQAAGDGRCAADVRCILLEAQPDALGLFEFGYVTSDMIRSSRKWRALPATP
jgi:hypothetical protein